MLWQRTNQICVVHQFVLCIAAAALLAACSTSTLEGSPQTDAGSELDMSSSSPNNTPAASDMSNTVEDLIVVDRPDSNPAVDLTAADGGSDAADAADVGPDADMAPMLAPACAISCTVPADCVTLTGGLFDEENYECDNGGCRWLGCDLGRRMRDGGGRRDYVH